MKQMYLIFGVSVCESMSFAFSVRVPQGSSYHNTCGVIDGCEITDTSMPDFDPNDLTYFPILVLYEDRTFDFYCNHKMKIEKGNF